MTKQIAYDIEHPEAIERIRIIAHQMWEDEGRPEGRAELHWLAAESIVKTQIESATTENPNWLKSTATQAQTDVTSSEKPESGLAEIRQRVQSRSAA